MKRREFIARSAGIAAGSIIPYSAWAQTGPCPPPSLQAAGGTSVTSACGTSTAQSDWLLRTGGPGVVWFHNFDAAAEVNQFRWTSGYSNGNDPLAKGSGANNVSHQTSGGADGGGFLRVTYPQNVSPNSCYWWRPFNALTGATNGRGSDDPGAGGTIAPVAFTVSDGSGTTYNWGNSSNPGWYMNAAHQASYPGKHQGSDYWVQVRVRRAQNPGPPPDYGSYTSITGKCVWLTTTNASYTSQELVTYGQSVGNSDVVGTPSRHNVYAGYNYQNIAYQDNAAVTLSNWNLNWRYSGGWDVLLYHITPGTQGGTGADRTRMEVWAAHPGDAAYTKIWDVLYTAHFDTGTNSVGCPNLPGWNGLICAGYHNGTIFKTMSFSFDYDQIIFSKASIPLPNDPTQKGLA